MAAGRRGLWLFAVIGLCIGACGGDDSSPTGSGTSATGGAGGAGASGGEGGTGATGGSAGAGGTGATGGEAGSGGSGGAGGNTDAGSGSDTASDVPSTTDGGDPSRCLPTGTTLHVVNEDSTGYSFDGGPLNPVINLCRGNKYTFSISAPGHPFYIRLNMLAYEKGVTGNFITNGDLVFDVPSDAPDMLFYQCDAHEVMTGPIVIVN